MSGALASARKTFGKVPTHDRDCQRCGRRFTSSKVLPYCASCYRAKRKESHAAYARRVTERAVVNRPGVAHAED